MSTPPDNQQKTKSDDFIPELFTLVSGIFLMIGFMDNTYACLAGLFLILSAANKINKD